MSNEPVGGGHPVLAPGRYVRIEVSDAGVGIPEHLAGRVFDAYFTTKPGGSGLGLTLAQSFVHQHHGTIEVDSRPGHTCFSLLLPLQPSRKLQGETS